MRIKWAVPLLCILLLVGCANQQVLTPDQMSPKQRATFAMNLYSNAFDNYAAQFAATPQPITGVTKDYFVAYKKALEVIKAPVIVYRDLVNMGGTPTPAQEQEILKLIYQLQAMLMKGLVK
jgi:hypothetical protein